MVSGTHHSAAKAGVKGRTKAWVREFGADQIRISALTPGMIQTELTGGLLQDKHCHASSTVFCSADWVSPATFSTPHDFPPVISLVISSVSR
ncbi:SDR family NAD(P)-dependent oxidoreductase [Pantoea sp. AS142]|uniref:SDR family NAD(P)-dependent oxidoreductase n=1 Tax=Pantoea sp. AS142 TaxID=3081292 RepID=UPI0030161958